MPAEASKRIGLLRRLAAPMAVPVDTLAPGSRFILAGEDPIPGVVLLRNTCRVRVQILGRSRSVCFVDADGKTNDFQARDLRSTDWSRGTPVIPMTEEQMSNFSAKAQKEEDAMAEKNPKLAKLKAKQAAAAKDKKPKAPKVPLELKPCGCGCGEKVTRRFKPGHDARFYGLLKRVAQGKEEYDKLPAFVRKQFPNKAAVTKEVKEHFKNFEV